MSGAVYVRTLGCKVNRVESDDLVRALLEGGAVLADADESDVIVVNTCTVTGEADAKARKAVRGALGAARSPHVVVTGCLAATDQAVLRALGDRVVVEPDKSMLVERVSALLDLDTPVGPVIPVDGGSRTRVAVKVQDGCDSRCAYCIVPDARGAPRSVGFDEVTARARELAESGVAEVVLTGINLGRYHEGDARLADVVRQVAGVGVSRIRLSSIEPLDLDDALLDALADTPEVCAHLHVPLQSGSDRVLALMNRRYTTDEFLARLDAARAALPGLAVTTDLIAGLPGETDADALLTESFVRAAAFSRLHVFRYSARHGTPAAAMTGQVGAATRGQRAQRLRQIDSELRASFAEQRAGRSAEVLVEAAVDETWVVGTTREYLRVRVEGPYLAGERVPVVLRRTASGDLVGTPVAGVGDRSRTS